MESSVYNSQTCTHAGLLGHPNRLRSSCVQLFALASFSFGRDIFTLRRFFVDGNCFIDECDEETSVRAFELSKLVKDKIDHLFIATAIVLHVDLVL